MTERGEKSTVVKLITPHGGKLINLHASKQERKDLIKKVKHLPSIQVSFRSLCDIQLMATGAFSPLDRFMSESDYRSVLRDMRLTDGTLFPIPITLPVDVVEGFGIGSEVVLRSPTNEVIAVMRIEEIFTWDLSTETSMVYGTTDSRHPMVAEMQTWGRYYLSGPLTVLNLPLQTGFAGLTRTPAQVRKILEGMGRENVIAFQPRHPMHRAHEALTKSAVQDIGGSLLIHPVAGTTGYNDMDQYTRVRCYQALVDKYYDPFGTLLNLLPLAIRMAGHRAGLWHGIINRNYGANHLIIGRDPHSPGKDSQGKTFYTSPNVQKVFRAHESEIGVCMLPHKEMVFMPSGNRYEESNRVENGNEQFIRVSTTNIIEESLFQGKRLPEWFTHPEIAQILYDAYPPRARQGFCVWLTGLPSSGKSTIADVLVPLLMAAGRKVSVLDGDVVRTHLTKGLGFGREDRVTNILRVGFVASEIVRHEGVAVCALISPYATARDRVRAMVGAERFIEVFVDTPLEVCSVRDVKGMYAMARCGKITGFTGVDDGYEPPPSPEVRINTVSAGPETNARQVLRFLVDKGFVADSPSGTVNTTPSARERLRTSITT